MFIFSSRACLNVRTRQRKEHRRLTGSAVLPAKQVKLYTWYSIVQRNGRLIQVHGQNIILQKHLAPDNLYLYIPLRYISIYVNIRVEYCVLISLFISIYNQLQSVVYSQVKSRYALNTGYKQCNAVRQIEHICQVTYTRTLSGSWSYTPLESYRQGSADK